jgi:hypothetical protein
MRKTTQFCLLFVATLAAAIGCDDSSASKYPGELGAPCGVDSDCKNGMLCSTVHLKQADRFCYAPCMNADSECPDGSICGDHGQPDSNGEFEVLRICYRGCETVDFCRDLNAAFNACQKWDMAQPICGIRG